MDKTVTTLMQRAPHFSRPVYESLPWVYIICGVLALIGSYAFAVNNRSGMSLFVGLLGFPLVVLGVMILLRRRNYRSLQAQYGKDPP
ncbi:MAG TPA: hypothetical protein VEH54_08865 [Steroidobacteraceae bacterium]|nr:hypothetical protein [Steroidobacteraceae bacterium]